MIKRSIGYILTIIGVLAIALTFAPIANLIPLTLPETITNFQLILGGIIVIIIGILLIKTKSKHKKSKTQREIPIYKGNDIIGYRRE